MRRYLKGQSWVCRVRERSLCPDDYIYCLLLDLQWCRAAVERLCQSLSPSIYLLYARPSEVNSKCKCTFVYTCMHTHIRLFTYISTPFTGMKNLIFCSKRLRQSFVSFLLKIILAIKSSANVYVRFYFVGARQERVKVVEVKTS